MEAQEDETGGWHLKGRASRECDQCTLGNGQRGKTLASSVSADHCRLWVEDQILGETRRTAIDTQIKAAKRRRRAHTLRRQQHQMKKVLIKKFLKHATRRDLASLLAEGKASGKKDIEDGVGERMQLKMWKKKKTQHL